MLKILPRFVKSLLLLPLALLILFEEWLWDPLTHLMNWITRRVPLARMAEAIARLSPHAALTVYLVPFALLLPFKLLGVWLIARHDLLLGFLIFLSAKVVGTALLAWLFSLTRPALRRIAWFRWCHDHLHALGEASRAWLRQRRLYALAGQMKCAIWAGLSGFRKRCKYLK